MSDLADCLDNYEGWLRHTAAKFGDPNLYEDLVQEGRIAMWGQLKKHGVEHSGFMTSQARLRMGQVARGEKAFGGTKVAVRDVKPVAHLEDFEFEVAPAAADIADAAMWCYHHADFHAAIDSLSPKRREAVREFLRDGVMTQTQRAAWSDARKILEEQLQHLRET